MSAKKSKPVTKPASKSKHVPKPAKKRQSLVGSMRGMVLRHNDLISPINVEWDANK
jgi:hypothetical protein